MLKNITKRITQSLTNLNYIKDMKVKIDELNYVVFNPQIGGRIIELKLQGKQIIKGEHK